MVHMYFTLLTVALFGIQYYTEAVQEVECDQCDGEYDVDLNQIYEDVCRLDGDQSFPPGKTIAQVCQPDGSALAAFTQNTFETIKASKACSLIRELVNHGCKVCGNIALGYPKDSIANSGELTVNGKQKATGC